MWKKQYIECAIHKHANLHNRRLIYIAGASTYFRHAVERERDIISSPSLRLTNFRSGHVS